jgi:hypothetical protein
MVVSISAFRFAAISSETFVKSSIPLRVSIGRCEGNGAFKPTCDESGDEVGVLGTGKVGGIVFGGVREDDDISFFDLHDQLAAVLAETATEALQGEMRGVRLQS